MARRVGCRHIKRRAQKLPALLWLASKEQIEYVLPIDIEGAVA
jgi:hypothetical protein